MKKIILLFLFVNQIALGQPENSLFPNEPYTELNSIAAYSNYIYTAGDCNTALLSTDGGQNWTTFEIDERIRNIKILPGTNGSKAIYQMTDRILTLDANSLEFEEISSAQLFLSSGNFVSVEVDESNIYVISNQNIHKAPAGDYNWSKIVDFNFDNDAVVNTDITENYLHIGTLNGLLLRSNLQNNEVNQMNDFSSRIYSFDMVNDDLGYFTIQNFTYPIKTTDGGLTYKDLDNLPENISVTGYGDNVIFTINTNRIYVSTDGGESSSYIPIPDDGTYDLVFSKYMTEDGVLYMAGRSSTILKTEDFGASFINLNDYKRENLFSIDMHSSGTGVAVGGLNSIIKSDDGGESWSFQDLVFGDVNNYINSVVVLSQNKYIVAGSNALAIIENDQISNTVSRGLDVMHYNSDEGYIIALQSSNSDYAIVKSVDEGLTWETKAFLPGYRYHISQTPAGKIYVPGIDGVIYTSIDAGDTWDIESFGEDLEVRKFDFLDENIGIASSGSKLYMTMDGGATTNIISSGYAISNLNIVSADQIFYTTANESQTNIYESKDGGDTFTKTKEFCSQTGSSVLDENNTVWLAQFGGHINKYQIEETNSTSNLSTNLITVYPNPAKIGQDIIINLEDEVSEVKFTSISGKTFFITNITSSNTISTLGMNKGLYTVSIRSIRGALQHGKLVIVE